MPANVELRRVNADANLSDVVAALNTLIDRDLGINGSQVKLYGYSGARQQTVGSGGVAAGTVLSSSNYTQDIHSAAGFILACRLSGTSKTAAPTATNCVLLVTDAGVVVGGATGDLTLNGNVKWKSGTAFVMELDHTATANRVITVPDATDTMVLLTAVQTLTSKTLTSPTINSGTLSGTFSGSPTLSGTVTFSNAAPIILSASAARITGPFGDGTRGNRPFFQSSTTNSDTNVNAMPNGSNTISKFEAYNNSTPASATGIASLEANSTEIRLSAAAATGAGLPLQVYVGSGPSKALDITAAGYITMPLQPRARAYNSAAFSHTSTGNWLAVTLDSERYDTAAMHSTSSNTSRITVPVAGNYHMEACVIWAANATGQRGVALRVNGTTFIAAVLMAADATAMDLHVSSDYDLTATDYVEMMAFQSSGGNLNVNASGNISPEFSMRLNG